MKVINKLVIALALAVPTSSLVTADELVINNNNTFVPGTGEYTPDMSEALKISPIGFEHIEVVPPGYDKPATSGIDTVKSGHGLQNVNLPVAGEFATVPVVLAP